MSQSMFFNRLLRSLSAPGAALWVLSALGCGSGSAEYSGQLPSPDGEQFVNEVYPLLLRDCAHVGCHGVSERFFQIYGPGRVRMREGTEFGDPVSLEEVTHSYQRAISMLASSEVAEDSLLLRKPLEAQAGGQGHKGVDDLGRNVFGSKNDPGWMTLRSWAKSKGSAPTQAQVDAVIAAANAGELSTNSAAEDSP
jgi:hypothetical protein